MTLKTSLIITGDSETAQKAVDDLKASVDKLGGAARGAVAPANDLGGAQADVARGAAIAAGAIGQATSATTGATAAGRELSTAQGAVAQSTSGLTAQMVALKAGQIVVSEASQMLAGVLAGAVAGAVGAVITGVVTLGVELATEALRADQARSASAALAGALADLDAAQRGSAKSARDVAAAHYAAAAAKVEDAIRTRQLIAAQLSSARADLEASRIRATAPGQRGELGALALDNSSSQVARLETEIATQDKVIATLRQTLRIRAQPVLQGMASGAVDANVAATRRFESAVSALDSRMQAGKISGRAYREEYARLLTQREQDTASTGRATASVGRHTGAVRSSSAAVRDHTKSINDNDAAQRQLTQDLQGAIAKYDPARKAAADYAEELERIDRLVSAGKLSADQGTSYMVAAMGALSGALSKVAEDRFTDVFGAGAVEKAEQEMWGLLTAYREAPDALGDIADATREAAAAQQDLMRMAAGAIDAIVIGGEKAGDVIDRLAKSIASAAIEAAVFGTGPLAALLKGGIGAGVPVAGTPIAAANANQAAADAIGTSVSKSMDRVFGAGGGFAVTLRNAGLGYAAGGATGSPLGGAIGGVVGGKVAEKVLSGVLGSWAGPLGSIAGGLLGGVIGKLFAPKAQPGGATVSAVNGQAAMSGTVGSDRAGIQAGSGLAGSVAQTINQVVSALGGSVGNFNVSIGKYKDDLRVNVNGRPLGGVTGSGAVGFGSDENAAVNYAAAQAIAQGAVQGVSDAVAKALRSSTDIDAALKEALKVQDIEVLMGGIGGQIEKAFKDFEATAKERVRIASQYGFDVVAIEKRNAEDRAKIAADLLKGQVGSLQQLIEEMTHGSLFEGTAVDRIAALKTEIEKAKADLTAGVSGAGDTLAGLYEQLNAASKAAYGSTGGYAADRTMILDSARAAIAQANAQIAEAQAKVSDPALAATNQALEENNDQNAEMLDALREQNDLLRAMIAAGGTGGGYDLAELARV